MTLFWSLKDIEKKSKTFSEVLYKDNAITAKLLTWVIMDVWGEDRCGKSNSFRVPSYDSLTWMKIISLGAYIIKEMALKESAATNREKIQTSKSTKQESKELCKETCVSSGQIKDHDGQRAI